MSTNEAVYKQLSEETKKRIIMYLTARQFKNSVLIEEMITIPAKKNNLAENSIISFDNQIYVTARGDKIISKHFPFLSNKAFACEVYLKFLLLENTIDFSDLKGKNGHNLLMLYEKMPEQFKIDLAKAFMNKGTLTNESLMNKMNSISEAFTEWRYIYENFENASADFVFLNNFCDYLDECSSQLIINKYNYDVFLDIR